MEKKDTGKFDKFKDEYAKILKDYGLQTDNFQLLAATDKGKTYILPEFEKLSLRGKSLLLIHESLIRNYGATVLQALQFDGDLLDFINLSNEGREAEFNKTGLENLVIDLKMGTIHFTKNYKVLTSYNNTLLWRNYTSDGVKAYYRDVLSAELFFKCVKVTKNQDNCELLENSLTVNKTHSDYYKDGVFWDLYSAEMKMRYLRSDKDRKNKLHVGHTGQWWFWDTTEEKILANLKRMAIEDGMKDCLNSAKDPILCKVQDKTFTFIDGGQVAKDGIIKKLYSGTISVVELRK